MRSLSIICLLWSLGGVVHAQIDTPNPQVDFELQDNNLRDPNGLEMPALKKPSLSNFKNDTPNTALPELNQDQKIDFSAEDGLKDYVGNTVPRAFVKDKEIKEEYGRDQHLGDVRTSGGFVQIKYRDHEFVDGDRIRVYINKDVVRADVALGGGFSGFTANLDEGYNEVVFEALNQGSSGPNTAELHVYNDKGQIISASEWNLLTGNKATIVVIREKEF